MRTLSLLSDTSKPCGVESFARGLAANLGARDGMAAHATFRLTGQPGEQALLARALLNYDALIVNFPVVAWKKRLLAPLLAMARARRHDLDVILVLHEWADLDWKRRLSYVPALRLATRILFSSPLVRAQFEADRASRFASRRRDLFPVPPNMARPDALPDTELTRQIARLKADGIFVLGQFGAIYPKKQTTAVLDIAAALRARGTPVHAVFIGDFISGQSQDPKADFDARVTALGLDGHVTVTGYIGPASEVFAAIEACTALAYQLPEGLTSRRGSVLAGLQTSTPVVVNAPAHIAEFDHHPTFTRALATNALVLVPPNAGAAVFADALLSLPARRTDTIVVNYARAWADVTGCIAPNATPASAPQPYPAPPSHPAAAA
jgi:glycosyltransferase involved in cell wall biosynthesis